MVKIYLILLIFKLGYIPTLNLIINTKVCYCGGLFYSQPTYIQMTNLPTNIFTWWKNCNFFGEWAFYINLSIDAISKGCFVVGGSSDGEGCEVTIFTSPFILPITQLNSRQWKLFKYVWKLVNVVLVLLVSSEPHKSTIIASPVKQYTNALRWLSYMDGMMTTLTPFDAHIERDSSLHRLSSHFGHVSFSEWMEFINIRPGQSFL